MSGSDSDDLEFESADEDQNKNENLSDLDLDEILNEDDDVGAKKSQKSENKSEEIPVVVPPSVENLKISDESEATKVNDVLSQVPNEPYVSTPCQDPDKKIENKSDLPLTDVANSGWDDSKFSDIDDDQETSTENKTEPLRETVQPKIESTSGWDDSKFSDIEDNPDSGTQTDKISKKSDQQPPPIPSPSKTVPEQPSGFGWSWSKIGTNLLSSAANLTTQMIETVEASLGAPDPAELAAKISKSQSENQVENVDEANSESPENDKWGFDNDTEWFSINKIASTGTNLVTSSLDVLESVGKKTFEMINDKDPNFKQTKELLKKVPISSQPNLSQLLREAQTQNIQDGPKSDSGSLKPKQAASVPIERSTKQEKLTFSLFFDEFKGSAHLEALEMLSSQANVKLEMITTEKPISKQPDSLRTDIGYLERLFDSQFINGDEDDDEPADDDEIGREMAQHVRELVAADKMFDVAKFESLVTGYARESALKLGLDKVIAAFRTTSLATKELLAPVELFNESIKCFALVTSNMIELFHKAAECVFVELESQKRDEVLKNVEAIFRITKLSIKGVSILSDDYSKRCKINAKQLNEGNPNQIITDIYLEASNSSTFIGDAYLLFLPIFKYILLKGN